MYKIMMRKSLYLINKLYKSNYFWPTGISILIISLVLREAWFCDDAFFTFEIIPGITWEFSVTLCGRFIHFVLGFCDSNRGQIVHMDPAKFAGLKLVNAAILAASRTAGTIAAENLRGLNRWLRHFCLLS